MKIQGGTIDKILASPSGQVVAHVTSDTGRAFMMPFGRPIQLDQIIAQVEAQIAEQEVARLTALTLHQEVMTQRKQLPLVSPRRPAPVITLVPSRPSRWQRVKLFIASLFRRKPL